MQWAIASTAFLASASAITPVSLPALWAIALAAFLASAVEFVEAFTIVLVVGVTINWRSSLVGALAAVATLALIVGTLGVAIVQWVPIDALRLFVGVILVLFGLKCADSQSTRSSGTFASPTWPPRCTAAGSGFLPVSH